MNAFIYCRKLTCSSFGRKSQSLVS